MITSGALFPTKTVKLMLVLFLATRSSKVPHSPDDRERFEFLSKFSHSLNELRRNDETRLRLRHCYHINPPTNRTSWAQVRPSTYRWRSRSLQNLFTDS